MNIVLRALTIALIVLSINLPTHASDVLARQITATNLADLPPEGIDAIGGVDDWLLSNGTLCAVVSASEHQAYLSLYGATLVDLWHCDSGNDQWVTMHEQRNLNKANIPIPTAITAQADETLAQLHVSAEREGIETETYYQLRPEHPNTLNIRYELSRSAAGEALNMLGFIILHPRAALVPYSLNRTQPSFSIGAQQPFIDTRDFRQVLSAVFPSALRVLSGIPDIQPPISYGIEVTDARLRDRHGREKSVQRFMIGSETFSIMGLFSEPVYLFSDTLGALSFLRGQFMDIEIGETLIVEMRITVGDRADVASVTDQLFLGQTVTGSMDAGPAGVTVKDTAGNVITFARSDENGGFAFRLPADIAQFELDIETPWSRNSHTFTLPPSADLGILPSGAYSTVHLPRGAPMSLVFKGENDTRDPIIHNTLTGISVGGARLYTGREYNRVSLAGTPQDISSLRLPPGHYRVIASRGIEYEVGKTRITATPGDSIVLDIPTPVHAVSRPDEVAADLHLHSGISMDSNITPAQRIIDFVAQGGEILVASEHNFTVDLQPVVQQLGLESLVMAVPGVELTGMARSDAAPFTIGHANVFPVTADSEAYRGGTLPFEGKPLGQVIGDYKAAFPSSLFQLNHARTSAYDSDLSFFNHLSYGEAFEPSLPLSKAPNNTLIKDRLGSSYRDIDFDILELLNGESLGDYLLIREDWFSLLRQGLFKIGTANSDSHLSSQLVSIPRTYLSMPDHTVATIKATDVAAALRSGNVYGTSGPLLDINLNGATMGDTLSSSDGTLEVSVVAASWVGIDELRVFVNGALVNTLPIANNETVRVPLLFDTDSFVTVEVSGPVTADYADVAPGFQPLAFSNPIFVDWDGNGYQVQNAL